MAAESFGISIGSKIAELLVEPVMRELRYAFCFNSFVEDLKGKKTELILAQDRVQNDIEAAIRNAEDIEKDVQAWVADANEARQVVQRLEFEIQNQRRCFISWCPNFIWQYRLNRRMNKQTTNLVLLQQKGKFKRVSYHAALPCIEFLSKDFMPSKSSQLAVEQIMDALRNDNISMIGLHGMGGVGKTTLVKEIGKQVNEFKLFDEVVMLVVSQSQDIMQIQDQLADKLYLYLRERSKEGRASRIWKRLKNENNILIILDDVWKYLDLKEIGIPFGADHKGCKVLLTTRLQHVCTSMDCQRKIPLHVLTEDEAWALFKINAGVDESSALTKLAMEVAKECNGLPIAIATVGRALRGKSLEGWELACRKLKASRLTDIRDLNKDNNAYTCFKLSFDYLQRDETKLCFLMCSLFPEDYEIPIEDLVGFAIGFGLFEDAQSVEEARSEVFESIQDLKASGLLLEIEKDNCAKMHDMVRDFALWIGSGMDSGFKVRSGIRLDKHSRTENLKNYTAISLTDTSISKFAESWSFPKLKMLLFVRKGTGFSTDEDSSDTEEGSDTIDEGSESVPSASFSAVQQLRVLSLAYESLSMQSLECLTNLRTLGLKRCRINCFPSVGRGIDLTALQSLQILNLHGSSIKELPEEIGELSNLKLLDITYCKQLERIPPNTIQRLSKLEELYIGVSSFREWEVEVTTSRMSNASLVELNSLTHLTVLWLYVTDDHIPKDFVFSCFNRYRLQINLGVIDNKYPSRLGKPASRSIEFQHWSVSTVNVCRELFLNAYDLHLEENMECFQNIIPNIDQRGFNHLIRLNLFLCGMECLISTKKQQILVPAFSNLEWIHLGKSHLKELCDGNPPEKFLEKLQVLEVFITYGLLTIFPAKLWRALQNLEKVVVHCCESLHQIFQFDELEGTEKELLSRLVTLKLEYVPQLRYIWKGPTSHVSLKSLTCINLFGCDSLTSILSLRLAQSLVQLQTLEINDCKQLEHIIAEKDEEGQESLSGSCMQSLGLQNLKVLKIHGCDKLEYVLPITAAKDLLHLEEIYIASVAELKQFFGKIEWGVPLVDDNDNLHCRPDRCFSNLHYFSSENYSAALPYLRHVELKGCPKLSMASVIRIAVAAKESSSFGQVGVQGGTQLKTLTMTGCTELEHVVLVDDDGNTGHVSLECRFQSVCFTNLLHIRVFRCIKLKKLFPIIISQSLPHLKYFEVIEAYQLGEVFEGNDETNDEKEIVMAKLVRLTLKELPNLASFCPKGYHFIFPSLETLTVEGCPQIVTRFSITPNGFIHSETEKTQTNGRDLAIEPATTPHLATAPRIASEGINWNRCDNHSWLPSFVEKEEGKIVQEIENSSNSCSTSSTSGMIKPGSCVTKKKK